MKIKKLAILLSLSISFSTAQFAFAEDTAVDRATRVEQIKSRWNPIFDQQYSQLSALAIKAKQDAKIYKDYNYLLEDFLHVRNVIDTALKSADGDIEAANAYAEEETGEFMMTIPALANQVVQIKTITCVKGKTIKKVTAYKAACPKGFTKKK
jgi:hypothetical protein